MAQFAASAARKPRRENRARPVLDLYLHQLATHAAVRSCLGWSSQDLVETPPARFMGRFELLGTEPSQVAVTSRSIVEGIDVVSHFGDRELSVFEDLLLDSLLFKAAEEGLGNGVVP